MFERLLGGLVAIGAVSSTMAWSEPNLPFQAQYERRPDVSDYASNYPRAAMDREMSGMAVLCCLPGDDRKLACRAASEWPDGAGFGAAAVHISQRFRLTPASLADYRSQPRAPIRMEMTFSAGTDFHQTDAYRDIAQRTANICEIAPAS